MPSQELIPFDWYLKKFPKQFKDLQTKEEFFEEIEMQLRKGAVAWIKTGIYLDQAKRKLGVKGYQQLCEELGLNRTTAWRYRKLARHPWLSKPKNWPHLPANQSALLLIAKHEDALPPRKLNELVEEEVLHAATEPKDLKEFLPQSPCTPKKTKPIISSQAIHELGGLPKDIKETEVKELNRVLTLAFKQWLKERKGRLT